MKKKHWYIKNPRGKYLRVNIKASDDVSKWHFTSKLYATRFKDKMLADVWDTYFAVIGHECSMVQE